jgi:hypothetical protein
MTINQKINKINENYHLKVEISQIIRANLQATQFKFFLSLLINVRQIEDPPLL